MAIYDDVKITINLNELVEIRAKLLTQYEDFSKAVATGEYLDENDVDRIATQLRETLTWDTLYYMVDGAIYDYMGLQPAATFEKEEKERKKYFKDNFEMVDLVSSSWTIQVPKRKTNA